jgi:hypothetical protein
MGYETPSGPYTSSAQRDMPAYLSVLSKPRGNSTLWRVAKCGICKGIGSGWAKEECAEKEDKRACLHGNTSWQLQSSHLYDAKPCKNLGKYAPEGKSPPRRGDKEAKSLKKPHVALLVFCALYERPHTKSKQNLSQRLKHQVSKKTSGNRQRRRSLRCHSDCRRHRGPSTQSPQQRQDALHPPTHDST